MRFDLSRRDLCASGLYLTLLASSSGALAGCIGARASKAVSVKDFGAVGDGINDDGPAIVEAIKSSRRVYFPPAERGYAVKTFVEATVAEPTVIEFNGQPLLFSGGRITLRTPKIATGLRLASRVERSAKTMKIERDVAAQAGDLMFIETSIAPASGWSDTKKDCILIARGDGEYLQLDEGTNFQYDVDDSDLAITIYRPTTIMLLNPNIRLLAPEGRKVAEVPLFLEGFRDLLVQKPRIIGLRPFDRESNIYRSGLWLFRCWGVEINNAYYEAMSYGIGVYGGTRNITERRAQGIYCHHSHADVGDWSAGYHLDGLHSLDAYQGLNTHPCFDAHARNFEIHGDMDLSNWRCIGGSLENGLIETMATDSAGWPQFSNNDLKDEYEYIYEDFDFSINNVTFVSPRRKAIPPVYVKYARHIQIDGVTALGCAIGLEGRVGSVDFGGRNRFGSGGSKPDSRLVSTVP